MKRTITITSQGQTTLPVAIRRKLGLENGGVLNFEFNEQRSELIISKPVGIEELSNRISRHIKLGVAPLQNVDEFYRNNRRKP